MSTFNRADYTRLFMLASELHSKSTSKETRRIAAELADMAEAVLGQLYRPEGMREAKPYPPKAKDQVHDKI